MSKQVVILDSTDLTAASFGSNYNLASGRLEGLAGLKSAFGALEGGNQSGTVTVYNGAVAADGYVTHAGAATAAQAMTLCNITITAVGSAPATNQFVVSATPATQATNLANAINASASFTGKVVASVVGARTVFTAVVPGALGNGFQASAGNLSNVTLTKAFAGGSNGTSYSL